MRIGALAAGFALAFVAVRAGRAYRAEAREWVSVRAAVPRPPDVAALGLIGVTFPSRVRTRVSGWYIPSRTGAAVILCHGSDADRSTMLPHARALAARGIGVLLFDWPGHGESEGVVRLGAMERAALEAALDFVQAQPDVRDGRIGALGFSFGSYVLAQVAALDHRVRATVLEGAFGDEDEETRAAFAGGGWVAEWAAIVADRRAGVNALDLRPVDLVSRIAPRPMLFVTGDKDRVVPQALSERLYAAARAPKDLWVIHGANHGEYGKRDSTYYGRLSDFFDRTLVP